MKINISAAATTAAASPLSLEQEAAFPVLCTMCKDPPRNVHLAGQWQHVLRPIHGLFQHVRRIHCSVPTNRQTDKTWARQPTCSRTIIHYRPQLQRVAQAAGM